MAVTPPYPQRNKDVLAWARAMTDYVKSITLLPSDGHLMRRSAGGTVLEDVDGHFAYRIRNEAGYNENFWSSRTHNITVRPSDSEDISDKLIGNVTFEAFKISGSPGNPKGDIFMHAEDSVHIDADDDIRIRAGGGYDPDELGGGDNLNMFAKDGVQIYAGSEAFNTTNSSDTLLTGAGDMTLWSEDDMGFRINDDCKIWDADAGTPGYKDGYNGNVIVTDPSNGNPINLRFVRGWATLGS